MEYSVVIPCAGMGERMKLGYNKLLMVMHNGKRVIENTVSVFLKDSNCKEVVLVVKESEKNLILEMFNDEKIKVAIGGKTRQESCFNGLNVVSYPHVLIHDGARPFITQSIIDRCLRALEEHEACLVAVNCKDTVKYVENGVVVNTPPRENLMLAQTPQAFKTKAILECHQQAKNHRDIVTDDSSIYELYGKEKVFIVEGDYANIKITTPEDIF